MPDKEYVLYLSERVIRCFKIVNTLSGPQISDTSDRHNLELLPLRYRQNNHTELVNTLNVESYMKQS